MNIPTIGGARGIFEIFIPGMFLLFNMGLAIYKFPCTDDETRELIVAAVSNPAMILLVVIGFGYLIGVLMRLLRADIPDKWSAAWIRRFNRHAKTEDGNIKLWASEAFPYIGWIGEMSTMCLPIDAQHFFEKNWAPRKREGQNKQFFNYCKILINSKDEKAASEIYAAESLIRYMSGMFYALLFAFVLLLGILIFQCIISHHMTFGLLILLIAYLVAFLVIVDHFRFIRIKEVETLFTATFHNKNIFINHDAPSPNNTEERPL